MNNRYIKLDSIGLRYLPTLFLDTFKYDEAKNLITDFHYLVIRLKSSGEKEAILNISSDFRKILKVFPDDKNLKIWEDFWRCNEHLLLRGNDEWPSYKILLQLSWENAQSSPVTEAAENYLKDNLCDWYWIRKKPDSRPIKYKKSPCKRVFQQHAFRVNLLKNHPQNPTIIFSGSLDGFIRMWDIASGKSIREFSRSEAPIQSLSINRNGTILVSVHDDGEICIWDIKNEKCIKAQKTIQNEIITTASINPSSTMISCGTSSGNIKIVDLDTFSMVSEISGYGGAIREILWFDDENRIASLGASPDRKIRIWDLDKKKCITTAQGKYLVRRNIALSPSNDMICSGCNDTTAVIWDTLNGNIIAVLGDPEQKDIGHSEFVNGVAFTPDGASVVTASNDETIQIWDLKSSKCQKVYEGHVGEIYSLALTSDGKHIVTGSDYPENSIRVWDINSPGNKKEINGHIGNVISISSSQDGMFLSTGGGQPDNSLFIWDLKTSTIRMCIKNLDYWATALNFCPDNLHFIAGDRNGKLRMINIHTGIIFRIFGHENRVLSIQFSNDGQKFASGGFDETAKVWDSKNGKLLCTYSDFSDWIYSICWNSDDTLMAVGLADGRIHIFDSVSHKPIAIYKNFSEAIISLSFIPTTSTLLSLDQVENIRKWNIRQGTCDESFSKEFFTTNYPDYYNLLFKNSINKTITTGTNNLGFWIQAPSIKTFWCRENIVSSFLGETISVVEKDGRISCLRQVDLVSGNRVIELADLPSITSIGLEKKNNINSVSKVSRIELAQACILLSWIIDGKQDPNSLYFISVANKLQISIEDRKDISKYVMSLNNKKDFKLRLPDLLQRSIKRINIGFKTGLISRDSSFGRRLIDIVEKAEILLAY